MELDNIAKAGETCPLQYNEQLIKNIWLRVTKKRNLKNVFLEKEYV